MRPTFWAYHQVLTELPASGYFVQRSPAHPLARDCCENEFAGWRFATHQEGSLTHELNEVVDLHLMS